MSLMAAVKIFCDLCIYFAAVGAVGSWFGDVMTMLWPGLLCAVGVGVAGMGERHRFLRLPGLLIPVLSFLLAKSSMDILFLLPAVLYTLVVIFRRRFALDYGDYYDFFFKGLGALGLILLFSLLDMYRVPVLFYGALYLLGGFFLLRQLRLGSSQNWRSKALNLAALLGTLAAGGGICFAVWGVFQLKSLLGIVLSWFLYILEYVLRVVFVVLDWVFNLVARLLEGVTLEEKQVAHEVELDVPEFEFPYGGEVAEHNPAVFYIMVTALFLLGAFFLVRWALRAMKKGQGDPPGREIRVERSAAHARPRRSPPGSHREKVRSCYRKFLRLLQNRGADITATQTTGEIYSNTIPLTDPEASSRLRRLYLAARYDETREVTAQQAKEAGALLKQLSKDPEY